MAANEEMVRFSSLFLIDNICNVEQSENIVLQNVVNFDGNIAILRLLHLLNAKFPISLTLFGIYIRFNEVQFLKALSPIFCSDSGSFIIFNALLPENASSQISSTPEGTTT
jgi:hypothetical protein